MKTARTLKAEIKIYSQEINRFDLLIKKGYNEFEGENIHKLLKEHLKERFDLVNEYNNLIKNNS